MESMPSAVAQSFYSASMALAASTSYGNVLAFQLNPRGGPNTCYRTISSITANTITWGAWGSLPNYAAIAASSTLIRASAYSVEATLSGVSPLSQTGTLYGLVGPQSNLGAATTGIGVLLAQSRIVATTVPANVVKTIGGFACQSDFDYGVTNIAFGDSDADVLTVMATNVAASTTMPVMAVVNWEIGINDRTTSVFSMTPPIIDLNDLQVGLRKIAQCQTFVQSAFDMGMNSPMAAGLGSPAPVFVGQNVNDGQTVTFQSVPEDEHFDERGARYASVGRRVSQNFANAAYDVAQAGAAIGPILATAALASRVSNPQLRQP